MSELVAVAGTDNPARVADVIFVHGLGGDARTTWMRNEHDGGTFWPLWLGKDFPTLGIWSLGYPAAMSAWRGTSMRLQDRAKSVLELLGNRGFGRRPLIFITHSLGGLVVKQALHTAATGQVSRWTPLAEATIGVAFIATPHAGAWVAKLPAMFSILRATSVVRDLAGDEPQLQALNDWFRTYAASRTFFTRSYSERLDMVPGFAVVGPATSWPGMLHESVIPLDEDHKTICKPLSTDTVLYSSVRGLLEECLAHAAAPLRRQPATVDAMAIPQPRDAAMDETWRQMIVPAVGSAVLSPETSLQGAAATYAQAPVPRALSAAMLATAPDSKPRFDELFETITQPDEVAPALFGTDRRAGAPYDVEYVAGRENIRDVRGALVDALLDSGGRLLIAGRAGTGKTRETSELATELCRRKWVVGVARADSGARLGAIGPIPPGLFDARLLLVIDDLQARACQDEEGASYLERLSDCIESLARQGLDQLRVIAITRDEPRFEKRLGLERGTGKWNGFSVWRLPDLTSDALTTLLGQLAARAGMTVEASMLARLVANSDHTPRTLFMNVELCANAGTCLAEDGWRPSQDASWDENIREVRSRHSAADAVQDSVRLLNRLGLPARPEYVCGLASAGEYEDRMGAVDALIDSGVLGRRRGELTAFAPEAETAGSREATDWNAVVTALTQVTARPPEWLDDLTQLAAALARDDRPARAGEVATLAIGLGADTARVFQVRAGAHFMCNRRDEALRDIDDAIARDPRDAASWFLRGSLGYLAGDAEGVLRDMGKARDLGHDVAALHAQMGMAHSQLQQWREAEAALGRAIEREGAQADAMLHYARGLARLHLGDLPGALQDFDVALEQPSSMAHSLDVLPAMMTAGPEDLLRALRQEKVLGEEHRPLVHWARGGVRLRLGDFTGAEQDLDQALLLGAPAALARLDAAWGKVELPFIARARNDLGGLLGSMHVEAPLLLARGVARREQGRFAQALEDFEQAIAHGAPAAEVRWERAILRIEQGEPAAAIEDLDEVIATPGAPAAAWLRRAQAQLALRNPVPAEQDADVALQRGADEAAARAFRGAARLFTGRAAEAEQDLSKAIELGRDDALVHRLRGLARLELGIDAVPDLDAAIERGAADGEVFFLRGCANAENGGLERAEADFDRALAAGWPATQVVLARGVARARLGRHADALPLLDEAIAQGQVSVPILVARTQARIALGDAAGAVEDLARATRLDPGNPGLLEQLVDQLCELRRYREALAAIDEVLAQFPERRDAILKRGIVAMRAGRFERAAGDLDRLIAHDPEDPQLRHTRSVVRYGLGDPRGAIEDLDVVVQKAPQDAHFVQQRGEARVLAGEIAEAERDFSAMQALHASEDDLRVAGALLALARNDYEGARSTFEQLASNDSSGATHLRLGLACLLAGRTEAAQAAYATGITTTEPGNTRIARVELDWALKNSAEPAGVQLIRQQLEAAMREADRSTGPA